MRRIALAAIAISLIAALTVPVIAEDSDLKSPTGVTKFFEKIELGGG